MKGVILAGGAGSWLYPRQLTINDNAPGLIRPKEALAIFVRRKTDLFGMVMC